SLNSLVVSEHEVATVFHLSPSLFTCQKHLKCSLFRPSRPYWVVDVYDIVSSPTKTMDNTATSKSEMGDWRSGASRGDAYLSPVNISH
ncbi:hypothetical protein SCLCIDRAFT_106550, partial [Scleroderma citrinum Foug A]